MNDYTQEDVAQRLGAVRLWLGPGTGEAGRPIVFAIPGILAKPDDLLVLGRRLGMFAGMCVMRLPSERAAALSSCAMADLSAVVGEILERRFADRPVVALGVSTGAVIALGVRCANLARVVAVEPPLVTEGLWPVAGPLSRHLSQAGDPVATAFAAEAFGIGRTGTALPDHLAALDGLQAPVDLMLGAVPLQPERQLSQFPSLVGEPERRRLAATPGVRLHLVEGAGHNLLGQAPFVVEDVLLEACRRAAARLPADRLRLDEPLLEATPLTARRVLHHGRDGAAFAEAYRRANPMAEVTVAGEEAAIAPNGDFDAAVLTGPPAADLLQAVATALRPGGHLIARWAAPSPALAQDLATHGLALREPVDRGGTGVVRAQKLAAGQAPEPALTLLTIAYVRDLMDIRWRLPTLGLQSDPELSALHGRAPLRELPTLPPGAPRVLVLQRAWETRPEIWRALLGAVMAQGWLVVAEIDDYLPLVAEVLGREELRDMRYLGYAHAVQTSTPALVEAYAPFNPEIAMFPNAVFDLAPFPGGPRPARVFYGAMLRGRYAVEVAASLGPAIEAWPHVEFEVVGDRDVFDALPTKAKRFHGQMSFEAYLDLMSRCAISLSPLEPLPFRDTKSDAKFLDAARAGVLTIASPTLYERTIRHGETGLLAKEVADWSPMLIQALTDEPGRGRMAKAAWDYVRAGRMFAGQAAQRRDWYRDLWRRRAELDEALMDRLPGLRDIVSSGRAAARNEAEK
jgi:SAM-dependent methyltransferase